MLLLPVMRSILFVKLVGKLPPFVHHIIQLYQILGVQRDGVPELVRLELGQATERVVWVSAFVVCWVCFY